MLWVIWTKFSGLLQPCFDLFAFILQRVMQTSTMTHAVIYLIESFFQFLNKAVIISCRQKTLVRVLGEKNSAGIFNGILKLPNSRVYALLGFDSRFDRFVSKIQTKFKLFYRCQRLKKKFHGNLKWNKIFPWIEMIRRFFSLLPMIRPKLQRFFLRQGLCRTYKTRKFISPLRKSRWPFCWSSLKGRV